MEEKVSVIIVTFNSRETIKKCLESVFKYAPKAEVLVVDNNSQDKTVEEIKKFGKKVILIESLENLGFAKACNLAASKATGNYLFFLNPDTEILNNALDKLVEFADNHPEAALIAPQLIKKNGEIQPSVKKLPTILGVILEYYFRQTGTYHEFIPNGNEPVEVEAVYGAAMLIKKEIFQKIKGFDERYFIYYEDLDLCKKIKKLGLKVVYYPNARVVHEVGASVKGLSNKKLFLGLRTLANFFPFKRMGSGYYQIISGNVYHGFIEALVIRILIYLALKMKFYKLS